MIYLKDNLEGNIVNIKSLIGISIHNKKEYKILDIS